MAKLLIYEKQRNLLLFSEFLKNETNFKTVSTLLDKHKNIGDKHNLSDETTEMIKENLPLWLKFSINEWESDKGNPYLLPDNEERKKCMLCGRKIEFLYKIKNKPNLTEIIVGGDCVQQFKALSSMSKMITNRDEYRRFNILKKKFPQIYDVLFEDIDFIQTTEIIVPDTYEKSFIEFQKKLIKQLRDFIKHKKRISSKELTHNLLIYENEKKTFQRFYETNKGNEYCLMRKYANSIESDQKEEYDEIIANVKRNKGQVSAGIASMIKSRGYLQSKVELLESNFDDGVTIGEVRFGQYVIEINRYSTLHRFVLSSGPLMKMYFYSNRKPFDLFYKENIDEFKVLDVSTAESLQILSESILETTPLLKKIDLDTNKIVSMYSTDLDSREYSETYQKVLTITQTMNLYSRKGQVNVLIYESSELLRVGKQILFSDRYEVEEEVIESHSHELKLNELYNYIIRRL